MTYKERHGPFKEAAEYLQDNRPALAYASIAKKYGLDSYARAFMAIQAIHEIEGHLTPELEALRNQWRDKLSKWTQENVSALDLSYLGAVL